MKKAKTKKMKDFFKNDRFELHSYITYLLLNTAK